MTTDFALEAIKSYIEQANPSVYPDLPGIPIYISQEDDVRDYPCIKVIDTGAQEHEILRGVYDPLTVEITLCTIPHASTDDGTTQTEHRDISNQLYNLIGDILMIDYLNDYTALKVFDIRGIESANEREDGKNSMTITVEIVCCQQSTIL